MWRVLAYFCFFFCFFFQLMYIYCYYNICCLRIQQCACEVFPSVAMAARRVTLTSITTAYCHSNTVLPYMCSDFLRKTISPSSEMDIMSHNLLTFHIQIVNMTSNVIFVFLFLKGLAKNFTIWLLHNMTSSQDDSRRQYDISQIQHVKSFLFLSKHVFSWKKKKFQRTCPLYRDAYNTSNSSDCATDLFDRYFNLNLKILKLLVSARFLLT